MRKKGKVLDMAAKYVTTKIREDVMKRIDPVVFAATEVHPKIQDFITDAVVERLEKFEELAKKRAAESKNGKRAS